MLYFCKNHAIVYKIQFFPYIKCNGHQSNFINKKNNVNYLQYSKPLRASNLYFNSITLSHYHSKKFPRQNTKMSSSSHSLISLKNLQESPPVILSSSNNSCKRSLYHTNKFSPLMRRFPYLMYLNILVHVVFFLRLD